MRWEVPFGPCLQGSRCSESPAKTQNNLPLYGMNSKTWNRGDGFGETLPSPMTDDDDTDEISDIEERISALAEIAERCRKFILASKIAIAGGFALLLVVILGLFGAGQVTALGSIALVLGGIVSLGSNLGTLEQTEVAIGDAEAIRRDLIGGMGLRLVHDTPTKLM
jgi:hypothetical protein